jgi:hypothetical protein
MSLIGEYINKKLSVNDLEKELLALIAKYNKIRGTYAFIYASAMTKPQIPDVALKQDDYYIIYDLLKDIDSENVDIYIETPGGSSETVEDIVRFLHNKFKIVSFVISGEAKSAGTIMVLSGDEILMTETASLGPIDAQVMIGRSVVSAYDYMNWTENKRAEAEQNKGLNPFDATIVAQISPGELSGVNNALTYAEVLVTDWLAKYKFKNWNETETRKIKVTKEMRRKKAEEIAKKLTNHGDWKTHGRSIKAVDLKNIGLIINRIESNKELEDTVYRIQTITRLLFGSTTIYKIFATEKEKVFKNATPISSIPQPLSKEMLGEPEVVEFEAKCLQCGETHKFYAKFITDSKIDEELKKKGSINFPKDNKFKCSCGYEMDLTGVRNEIELKMGKKFIL